MSKLKSIIKNIGDEVYFHYGNVAGLGVIKKVNITIKGVTYIVEGSRDIFEIDSKNICKTFEDSLEQMFRNNMDILSEVF